MDEQIVILDRGNAELAIPKGWSVRVHPEGHMVMVDPRDDARLEASYMPLPAVEGLPPVEERLRWAFASDPNAREHEPILTIERGPLRIAYSAFDYESDDSERAERRPAIGRWAVGANRVFQVLITYYHWRDDEAWAHPVFDRVLETLQLGDGSQLARPEDHWSLREPD